MTDQKKTPIGQDAEYTGAPAESDVVWTYYRSGPDIGRYCSPDSGYRVADGPSSEFYDPEGEWIPIGKGFAKKSIVDQCRQVPTEHEAITGEPEKSPSVTWTYYRSWQDEGSPLLGDTGYRTHQQNVQFMSEHTHEWHNAPVVSASEVSDWCKHVPTEHEAITGEPEPQGDDDANAAMYPLRGPTEALHYMGECVNHAKVEYSGKLCIGCLLESVDTLTQEVARLEGERDDARNYRDEARGLNKAAWKTASQFLSAETMEPWTLAQCVNLIGTEWKLACQQRKAAEKERDELQKMYDTSVEHQVSMFEALLRGEATVERIDGKLVAKPMCDAAVDPSAQVQHLLDRVKAAEKKLADVDGVGARTTRLSALNNKAIGKLERIVEAMILHLFPGTPVMQWIREHTDV